VKFTAAAVLLSLLTGASTVAEPVYRIVDLGAIHKGSSPWALNDRGDVVGSSYPEGFLYLRGRMQSVKPPNAFSSEVFDINDKGDVVGSYFAQEETHAFRRSSSGDFLDLGSLGGTATVAVGINSRGQIAGWGRLAGSEIAIRAFIYDGALKQIGTLGGNTYATAINNDGDMVGYFELIPGLARHHAFLYQNGTTIDLGTLGGEASTAYDINDRGQIVGTANTSSGAGHAFLYENGKMQDLGRLGVSAQALGINNKGQIVGQALVNDLGDSRAFIYHNGRMRDLNKMVEASSGWVLLDAWDINDRGQIAVYGCKTRIGCRALRLDPVALKTDD
jgi:probable HAF family extracellular repeat protein